MIEDSIICSPSKSSKSIREARQQRLIKRKKVNQSVQINSGHVISEFYKDSDDESSEAKCKGKNSKIFMTKPSAIITTFQPFELEVSLAMADHLLAQQFEKNNRSVFPETQGFITCTSLSEAHSKKEHCKTNETNGTNALGIITESELLNFCHQAEKILEIPISTIRDNQSIVYAPTRNKNNLNLVNSVLADFSQLSPNKTDNLELVNSILCDFSQSPLGKEQLIKNTSGQYSPEFRLRRLPVKTYSRRFLSSTKTNLSQRFGVFYTRVSSEYHDNHSSCSSLSIQEDISVGENLDQSVRNSNNTQRLCENLLNLTEYFTQNESRGCVPDEHNQQDTNNLNFLTNRKRYDSYNSIDDFHGFTNKEDTRNIIDTNNDAQIITNNNLNITHDFRVCEDYPRSDCFSDDDCHEIFAYINTEDVLQDNIRVPNYEMQNAEKYKTPKAEDNNEQFIVPEILNQNPTSSIVFKTASSKPIKVSREAHIMAAKILSKLPDIAAFEENTHLNNCDIKNINKDINLVENPEDYEWNDDCDLFLNIQTPIALKENLDTHAERQHNLDDLLTESQQEYDVPSTSKMALGFKTAGGKNLRVSKKAQKSVQKILSTYVSDLKNEEELKEIKCNVYSKNHKLEAEKTAISDMRQHNSGFGFQTAKGKNISISRTGQKYVNNLLKEFCPESKQKYEEDLEIMKQKIYKKNNEIKQSIAALNCAQKEFHINPCKNIDISKAAQEKSKSIKFKISSLNPFDKNNMGFHTTISKTLNTSTKVQESAQRPSEESTKKDLLNDFKFVEDDVNTRNDTYKDADKNASVLHSRSSNLGIEVFNECLFEKLSESYTNEPILLKLVNEEGNTLNKEINMGIQTGNGKNILISVKGQQKTENVIEDFNTVFEIKNKQLNSKSAQEDDEYINMQSNQCHSSSKEDNKLYLKTEPAVRKRKKSIENIDLEGSDKTPPAKSIKNGLHTSKSSFAEQSLKSPLTTAPQCVILRKNLLSLTKRRKSKRNLITAPSAEIPKMNKEIYNLNVNGTSPIKSYISLGAAEQVPVTPNLKEFLSNAPLTSTPRINNPPWSPQTIEDSDLKPITWKSNNDSMSNKSANNSMRVTKLSDDLTSNITLNSSNPTAKERIGRLKMYGKAPDVSPILIETHHNCRPSGLRRTRSMLKKTEK